MAIAFEKVTSVSLRNFVPLNNFVRGSAFISNLRIDWIRHFSSESYYPYTDFHFIGHSNGTYILGESLKRLPGMQFKRIYLAGSVLPRDYPWRDKCDKAQVEKLCNARSSFDWPVGILCNGLRGVGMRDIGTGGFDGFLMGEEKRLKELYYFDGDRGKPLEETYQDLVVKYILTGNISEPQGLKSEEDIKRFQLFSRSAPFISKILLLIVVTTDCFLIFSSLSFANALIVLATNALIAILIRMVLIVI